MASLRYSVLPLSFKRCITVSCVRSADNVSTLTTAQKETEMKETQMKTLEAVKRSALSYSEHVNTVSQRWRTQNEIYYGKDRDLDNFPTPKQTPFHPKVRLGFIPDTWFQAFYDKTGVSGPYMLMFGSLTYMLSKEVLVVDHDFGEIPMAVFAIVFLSSKFGGSFREFVAKIGEERRDSLYRKPVAQMKTSAEVTKKEAQELITNESGQKHLFQAKREAVDLQLELAYRQRLVDMHKAVKSRLDYQVDKETTKRNFQQQYMLNWIVDNVKKDISAQQEKDALLKCIADIKVLAKTHAGTIKAT